MSEIKKNIIRLSFIIIAAAVLILGSSSLAYYAGYNSVDCEKERAKVTAPSK